MLSIQNAESKKCTPNLLPARINHDGPINSTSRYWAPTTDEKGTTCYNLRTRSHSAPRATQTGMIMAASILQQFNNPLFWQSTDGPNDESIASTFTDAFAPGTQHVYFRGRHLHGTTLPLPSNYTGAVLNITDKLAPQTQTRTQPSTATESTHDDDEDMEQELLEEVKVAEQIGEFDSIVVWGHGGVVDEGSDMFVRGVREWVGFAEALHCDEEDGVETNGAKPS